MAVALSILAAAVAAGLIGFGVAVLVSGKPIERWMFEGTMLISMGCVCVIVAAGMIRR